VRRVDQAESATSRQLLRHGDLGRSGVLRFLAHLPPGPLHVEQCPLRPPPGAPPTRYHGGRSAERAPPFLVRKLPHEVREALATIDRTIADYIANARLGAAA